MEIMSLIEYYCKHPIKLVLGESLNCFIDSEADELYLVLSEVVLMDKGSISGLLSKYHIRGLFDLSNCYMNRDNDPYMLWHLSKEKPNTIKTSLYYKSAHMFRDDSFRDPEMPSEYKTEYMNYLNSIEEWVDTNKQPSKTKGISEFNSIPLVEFDVNHPYPYFYKESNTNIRNMIEDATFKELGEVSDIVMVSLDSRRDMEKVNVFGEGRTLGYPYTPELHSGPNYPTTELVHKGDIVYYKDNFFLIDKESDTDVFAPAASSIIRARCYNPEYLYIYLTSKTSSLLRKIFNTHCGINAGNSIIKEVIISVKKKVNRI